jgi:hypothetical protein
VMEFSSSVLRFWMKFSAMNANSWRRYILAPVPEQLVLAGVQAQCFAMSGVFQERSVLAWSSVRRRPRTLSQCRLERCVCR